MSGAVLIFGGRKETSETSEMSGMSGEGEAEATGLRGAEAEGEEVRG
jgi:hypothetical protein